MTCVTGARRNSLLFLPWRSEEGGFFFCLKQQSRWEVDTSGSARLSCNALLVGRVSAAGLCH